MARAVHAGRPMSPMLAVNVTTVTYTRPRLQLLTPTMTDDTRRDTPTDVAPPPSAPSGERITLPPEPELDTSATMLPAAGRTPSDFKEVAVNDVIAGQRQLQLGLDQLLGPGGRLEAQTAAIAAVVEAAATRQMQSYDMLRQDMLRRFELTDARDKDQDAKLASVTAEIVALTGRISLIEQAQVSTAFKSELDEIKSSVLSLIEAVETMGNTDKSELAGRKVLLVDDVEILLRTLTRVAAARGATVLTATTLGSVKALMETFDPDCALVDVRLGEGEDGAEVAKWLIGAGMAPSQVLLMTGDTGPRPEVIASALGLKLFLKPLGNTEFVRVIREASASRQNSAPEPNTA